MKIFNGWLALLPTLGLKRDHDKLMARNSEAV